MDKIIIRSDDDLIEALPKIIGYRPDWGSAVLIDADRGAPTCVLYRDLLGDLGAGPEPALNLASQLLLFTGRPVILTNIGVTTAHRFTIDEALRLLGAEEAVTVKVTREQHKAWGEAGYPTRGEYLDNGGRQRVEDAWGRMQRIVKGVEARP